MKCNSVMLDNCHNVLCCKALICTHGEFKKLADKAHQRA